MPVEVTGFARGVPRVQLDIRLHCMSKLVAVGIGAWPMAGLIQLLRSSMRVAVGIGAKYALQRTFSFCAVRSWGAVGTRRRILLLENVEAAVNCLFDARLIGDRGSF